MNHPTEAELLNYMEGKGDPVRIHEIEQHLEECELCQMKRKRFAEVPGFLFPHLGRGSAAAIAELEATTKALRAHVESLESQISRLKGGRKGN